MTVAFAYDGASRMTNVTYGTANAGYSYVAGSRQIGQTVFKNSGTTRMTTARTFDAQDKLISMVNTPGTGNPLSFTYGYNAMNDRTNRLDGDLSHWAFGYDSLGRVTSGKKYWADNENIPGEQYTYSFDDIGNRTGTQAGGNSTGGALRSASYTANTINEYTSRDVPNQFDDIGLANYQATVKVNGVTSDFRRAEFFQKLLTVTNSSAAVWLTVTNTSTNATFHTDVVGHQFIAETPESYSYDADGNLTQDGRWNYTYDAENRLINMTSLSGGPAGSLLKLDFMYDFMGRRIQKIVSTNNAGTYTPAYTNRFVYDGWNQLATLDNQSLPLETFVWGLDLSGNMRGAGGVGGLLMAKTTGGNVLFAAYDGAGNVAGVVDGTTGTVVERNDYGPFGELLRLTPNPGLMPFGFSSKYRDDETGLVYYGRRYLQPDTGRWLNHDPIGEYGGMNLYGFVGNNANEFVDSLGLWWKWTYNWMPNGMVRWLAGPPTTPKMADPNSNIQLLEDELGPGTYDASQLHEAADVLQFGAELNPIVDGFDAGYDLFNGRDAITGDKLSPGDQIQAAARLLAAALPITGKCVKTKPPTHHIATDKSLTILRGGPWTPRFAKIFKKADMSLQDQENLVRVLGHVGPHSERYHQIIYDRLLEATSGLSGSNYRSALIAELKILMREILTPGSELNLLVTGQQ